MPDAPAAPSKTQTFLRRTFSTLLLWGVVGAAFGSMKPWAHLTLIGFLALWAMVEFCSLSRLSGIAVHRFWAMTLSAGYGAAVSYFLWHGQAVPAELDIALLFLLVCGTLIGQLRQPIDGVKSVLAVTSTIFGVLWLTWLFYFTARLDFAPRFDGSMPGAYVLLWCLAVTKFTDMGAYITGSLIGKHKMIPHISPAKTWEGFAGALLFALIAAGGLYALFPTQLAIFPSWLHVIGLSQIVALLAVVGDLAESLWKRSLAVKDSGHALPGIGGAMDLIDSLCFTAPAVYLYVVLFL
ncbi:MAG: phosphatidate cytidylyltransferase [Akkermansiaceae bacterium]